MKSEEKKKFLSSEGSEVQTSPKKEGNDGMPSKEDFLKGQASTETSEGVQVDPADEKDKIEEERLEQEAEELQRQQEADEERRQKPAAPTQANGGGGGGLGAALSQAAGGAVAAAGKVAGGTLNLAGTGIKATSQQLQARHVSRKAQGHLIDTLEKAKRNDAFLRDKIRQHNELFADMHDAVVQKANSTTMKRKYSDPERRRQAALHELKKAHPETYNAETSKKYAVSRNEIERTVEMQAQNVAALASMKEALKQADEDTKSNVQEFLEAHQKNDNVFKQVAELKTPDGQEDKGLKEKMKKISEEIQKMLQEVIDMIFKKVFGGPS